MELLCGLRPRGSDDGLRLFCRRCNVVSRHIVAKALHSISPGDAFGWVDEDTVINQSFKPKAEMFAKQLFKERCYEDVVYKNRSRSTSSINLWKTCAALRKPTDMYGNSDSPKGVVIGVLQISSGATLIWWYALTKSSIENTVLP